LAPGPRQAGQPDRLASQIVSHCVVLPDLCEARQTRALARQAKTTSVDGSGTGISGKMGSGGVGSPSGVSSTTRSIEPLSPRARICPRSLIDKPHLIVQPLLAAIRLLRFVIAPLW